MGDITQADDPETIMKHYTIIVDVLKFYFDLILKFITFSFAATGAIVSYYLSQPNTGFMRFALVLPFILNIALAGFAFYASGFVGYLDKELDRIRDTIGFKQVVDATFLTKMLYLAGFLSTVIAFLLFVLFCSRPVI